MKRLVSVLGTILLTAAAALCATLVTPTTVAAATPVRIMPLGDSITAGTGCWRAFLWNRLQTTGYTNIDFVGSVSDGGGCNPGFSYDFDHEGHGGYSATGIADQNLLPGWLDAAKPDIVMVHLGTNDMWGGYIPLETKLTAFTKLVGQMRTNNPNVKIIVAQIIPMAASACSTCPADVLAFDQALPAWAAGLTTTQSPIVLADLWTGYDAVADNVDGVHPNTTGYQKMAAAWYPVLANVLSGVTTPATTTTTTRPTTTTTRATTTTTTRPTTTTTTTRPTTTTTRPTTTTTTTRPTTTRPTTTTTTTTTTRPITTTSAPPSGSATCSAAYAVQSQWSGGFVSNVTVTAGSSAIQGWTVALTLPSGATLTNIWNGVSSGSSGTVTVTNQSYNGALGAGQTATFGFQGNGTGSGTTVSCTAR